MFSRNLTSDDIDGSIEGNPNACSEAGSKGPMNEGVGGIKPSASLETDPLPPNHPLLTIYDLPEWFDATGAQGDPRSYSKSDLEMWIVRIFNNHKFLPATASKGQKRRAFEEIWDATNGESIAIAYGFNAALEHRIYSLNYVKTCAKNMKPVWKKPEPEIINRVSNETVLRNAPKAQEKELIKIKRTPAPVKEKKVVKKPTVEVPDVEWN